MTIGISETDFARIFNPPPLAKYVNMLRGDMAVAVKLSQEEAAAVLQAHDYGLAALPPESLKILDRVMSKMKENIWP